MARYLLDLVFDGTFALLSFFSVYSMYHAGHLKAFAAAAVCVTVLIVVVIQTSQYLAAVFSRHFLSAPPFSDPLKSIAVRKKFAAQFWQLCIHSSMAALAFYVAWDEEWLTSPQTCVPWNKPKKLEPKSSLVALYVVQLAIWVVTCISHRFIDTRNKDYYVMYLHHLTTIGIVLFSFSWSYLSYGLFVFFVHDLSDVFLDLLKITNYFKLQGKPGLFIVEGTFVIQFLVWVGCRLVFFPYFLYIAILVPMRWGDTVHPRAPYCDFVLERYPMLYVEDCLIGGPIALALLCILQCMHVWWTWLLIKVIIRSFKSDLHESADDVYERYDEDDDDSAKPKANQPVQKPNAATQPTSASTQKRDSADKSTKKGSKQRPKDD